MIDRTGWVLRDVKEAESIADHMYRMAVMSFLAPENVDKNKYKLGWFVQFNLTYYF